jgi:hypothetical protein
MNAIWEGVKATAGIVGQAAVETGMKGKLQADLMLINLEIENRKRAFGEELYDYVVSMCNAVVFLDTRVSHNVIDSAHPFLISCVAEFILTLESFRGFGIDRCIGTSLENARLLCCQ